MGPGLTAMIVLVLLIVIWTIFVKRNITEIAFIGLVVVCLFGGADAPKLFVEGIVYTCTDDVLFASLAFVVMSFLLQNSKILDGLVHIFTRLFGRLSGGPAYVNTGISSFLGMMSGGNTPNAATSGAFTADWMMETGWSKEQAATLIAANGGLAAGFPPSSSMFIVLAFPTVAAAVAEGELYIALFVSGIYQVLWRIVYIQYIVHKNKIQPTLHKGEHVDPIHTVLRKYGSALLILIGVIIPVGLNMGPVSQAIANRSEAWTEAIDSMNLLVWIPTMMILIILIMDGKNIAKKFGSMDNFVKGLVPQFAQIAGMLVFIVSASRVITLLGLDKDVEAVLEVLNLPPVITALVILILVAFVAGPFSSTATLNSVGLMGHSILTGVGIDPLLAAVAMLVVASTEGASPPSSGAIYVACGLTSADPPKTFFPLIVWFVVPIVLIAFLICIGILPVP